MGHDTHTGEFTGVCSECQQRAWLQPHSGERCIRCLSEVCEPRDIRKPARAARRNRRDASGPLLPERQHKNEP